MRPAPLGGPRALQHRGRKATVRANLGAHAYPRWIEFADDLPKTLTGKLRRIELRDRELGRA